MKRPRFELRRVRADGTRTTPEIVPMTALPGDLGMDRRGFFGTGITAASLALLLKGSGGCGGDCFLPPTVTFGWLEGLVIAPDGRSLHVAVRDDSRGQLHTWSLPSGVFVRAQSDPDDRRDSGESIAVSPDGTVITGTTFGRVNLWAGGAGPPARLGTHTDNVRALAVSRDGATLASASRMDVRLWSLAGRSEIGSLGTGNSARSMVFTPDGATLVVGAGDDVALWDVASRTRTATLPHGGSIEFTQGRTVDALALAADGDTLASLSGGVLRLWSLSSRQELRARTPGGAGLAFTPDGATVIVSDGAQISLLSNPGLTSGGTMSQPLHGAGEHLALSPDGSLLVSAGSRLLRTWDVPGRRMSTILTAPGFAPERCPEGSGSICVCVPVFV